MSKFIFKTDLITLTFKLLLKYKLQWSKDKNWESTHLKVVNIDCMKKPIILTMKFFLVIDFFNYQKKIYDL